MRRGNKGISVDGCWCCGSVRGTEGIDAGEVLG